MDWSSDDERDRYDPETATYSFQYNWESDTDLSTVLIDSVAALTDIVPTEIGPLYEAINPDALDHLFAPTQSGTQRETPAHLQLSLNECAVTIHSDGRIEIRLPDERA